MRIFNFDSYLSVTQCSVTSFTYHAIYIASYDLFYNWKFVPFDPPSTILPTLCSLPLAATNLFSVSVRCLFFWFCFLKLYTCKWHHAVFILVFFHLTYLLMLSRSIHVVAHDKFAFFLWLSTIRVCVCVCVCVVCVRAHMRTPHHLCPFICEWTLTWFPYLGYCQ